MMLLLALAGGLGAVARFLADALIALIAPIRQQLEELRRDGAELDRILEAGAEQASKLADPVLEQAKLAVGLGR